MQSVMQEPEVAQEDPQQGWLREQAQLIRDNARRAPDPGQHYFRADALDALADNIPRHLSPEAWQALWNWETWISQCEQDTDRKEVA